MYKDLVVARPPGSVTTLRDAAGPGGSNTDCLAALPRAVDIVIVVEVVDKFVPFEDDDLEVLVRPAEVALDDRARPGGVVGDGLGALPGVVDVAVVMEVVDEVVSPPGRRPRSSCGRRCRRRPG